MKIGIVFDYEECWMIVGYELDDDNCDTIFSYNGNEHDFDQSYELMKLKSDEIINTKFRTYDDICGWEKKINKDIFELDYVDILDLKNNYSK